MNEVFIFFSFLEAFDILSSYNSKEKSDLVLHGLESSIMHFLYQLFETSYDAVFGIDSSKGVCFWNDSCQRLLGASYEKARPMKCYEVIGGVDLQGNPVCGPECGAFEKINQKLPVEDYDIVTGGMEGTPQVFNVGTFITPAGVNEEVDAVAFHVLRRIDIFRFLRRLHGDRSREYGRAVDDFKLTSRELEVLELATHGLRTSGIAERLSISETTVRNHFQNIFSKMNVHSRAEAVGLALRSDLF